VLPFLDGDARKDTRIYPGSGKRRPYVQRGGGEVSIILHLSACTGVNTGMVWMEMEYGFSTAYILPSLSALERPLL